MEDKDADKHYDTFKKVRNNRVTEKSHLAVNGPYDIFVYCDYDAASKWD
jgi:hypothetical protein